MADEYVTLKEERALIALPKNTIGAHITVAMLDENKQVYYVEGAYDRQFLTEKVQETKDGYLGNLAAPEGTTWVVLDIPAQAVHVDFTFDVFEAGKIQQKTNEMEIMDIVLAFAYATDYIGNDDEWELTEEGRKYVESLETAEEIG